MIDYHLESFFSTKARRKIYSTAYLLSGILLGLSSAYTAWEASGGGGISGIGPVIAVLSIFTGFLSNLAKVNVNEEENTKYVVRLKLKEEDDKK